MQGGDFALWSDFKNRAAAFPAEAAVGTSGLGGTVEISVSGQDQSDLGKAPSTHLPLSRNCKVW